MELCTQKFQWKDMSSVPWSNPPAPCRNRAGTAPRRTQRLKPLAFATPCIQRTVKTPGFACFLTFKLAHCPTPATQTATSWLSTSWLSYSSVSYLLITLPLDRASVSYLLITLPLDCLHRICTSVTLRKAITPCFFQCNYPLKNFKEKLCPGCDEACAVTAPALRRAAHSVSQH